MSAKAKGPGTRLGTQMRGRVAAEYDKRGHGRSDLYLHYSWKAQKDVVLLGQMQFLHFLHCEFAADVVCADYSPFEACRRVTSDELAELVHAVVTMRDGSVVWRRLLRAEPDPKQELSSELQDAISAGRVRDANVLELWTQDRLLCEPTFLRNALRAQAWIAAARERPLGAHRRAVLKLVTTRRCVDFEQVLALGEGAAQALYAAAALQLVGTGSIRSNLHEAPLTAMSLFRALVDQ